MADLADLFNTIVTGLRGSPKKATDSMAGKGSVAGAIKDRRDAAMYADEPTPTPDEQAELRRRQHADHNN